MERVARQTVTRPSFTPFAASLPPSSVPCSLRSPFHYPPEAPRAPGPKGPDPARGAARRMEWE